jgi:hypothetical protein
MELQKLDFTIQCVASKLASFVDMRRRVTHPENIAHYTQRVMEVTEELKALHYQRLGKLSVAPKAKLPGNNPRPRRFTVQNAAAVRPQLNRSAVVSDIGDQVTVKRGDRVRVYSNFGRCATPGEARLFHWLRQTSHLWNVEPFSFKADGSLFTAIRSKVWTSK